ncbi:UNVERIFIED_CONTAM: hypothetical protein HDU68_007197 [Siphonaria sp. JEL0065]|nr:hypothetical protein HDU68_007197 [Siphonaria sp. JEL0065]
MFQHVPQLQMRQSTFNGVLKVLVNSECLSLDEKKEWVDRFLDLFWKRVGGLDGSRMDEFKAGTGRYASFIGVVVKFYASTNDVDSIMKLSKSVSSLNASLGIYANNTILKLLFQMDNKKLAVLLFKEMSRTKRLNTFTINTILKGLHVADGSAHSALTLFGKLQKLHPTVLPDVVTYTTLIDICFKEGMAEKAKSFYGQMTAAGIQPNVITCTALMDGLLKSGDVTSAVKVFASYESPDTIMHTSWIHKLTIIQDDAAVKESCMHLQEDQQNAPDLVLFNILLYYFLRTKQSPNSVHILGELDNYNLSPDTYTSTAIIYGLVLSGEYKAAEPATLKMLRNGIPISLHGITSLINGLSHGRQPIDMVRWMEAYLKTPVISSNSSAIQELSSLSRGKILASQVSLHLNQRMQEFSMLKPDKLDYKFFSTCVNGLLRMKAVLCADLVVRDFITRSGNSNSLAMKKGGGLDSRIQFMVERVSQQWVLIKGDEERGVDIVRVYKEAVARLGDVENNK